MEYCFQWDPHKAIVNYRKHRVGFDQAATVFLDPRALSLYDDSHSDEEDHWITLGMSAFAGLLVVHHTYEEDADASTVYIRIISSRKATNREVRQYAE